MCHTDAAHISPDTFGATVWARAAALPLLLSEGTAALTMVSPLPPWGDTSEWFVVGEDWWTAIATLFLCKINSTCRSALYEWWRPPQAIHTAAQRHGCGPHSTYKAGIKQSLFWAGPCITHTHTHTWTYPHEYTDKPTEACTRTNTCVCVQEINAKSSLQHRFLLHLFKFYSEECQGKEQNFAPLKRTGV